MNKSLTHSLTHGLMHEAHLNLGLHIFAYSFFFVRTQYEYKLECELGWTTKTIVDSTCDYGMYVFFVMLTYISRFSD